MKIAVFEKRPYEEIIITEFAKKNNIEIVTPDEILNDNSIHLCEGADAITTLGFSKLTKNYIDKVKSKGVRLPLC